MPAKAAKVRVTGYRATTQLSNGQPLVELALIAERRARKLETILLGLGIPQTSLEVTWREAAEPGDGVSDPLKRRAVISVVP